MFSNLRLPKGSFLEEDSDKHLKQRWQIGRGEGLNEQVKEDPEH
jgi:hypothetical protein